MKISGWGKYPLIESEVLAPQTPAEIAGVLRRDSGFNGIARGMGRSYGDSSLAPQAISTRFLDHILGFDASTGMLRCAAGATLADLLQVFVPKGRFLPVTPGTKFVTVGGAIASDVHGKNHHVEGSFCDHVESFRLMLASGDIITCSRTEHAELFRATCGGMGLTGVIVDVTLKLKAVGSAYLNEVRHRAVSLDEAFALFEEYGDSNYSVAWVDCLAKGGNFGRSLVWLGEHAQDGRFDGSSRNPLTVPLDMPDFLLNHHTMTAFAGAYYRRGGAARSERTSHYESFFYPLDGIHHWNRIYGKRGFVQYQFVISREAGIDGMKAILQRIVESQSGSFLAVLKAFGKGNDNLLSFPMEGYTLALDFKLHNGLFDLLDRLDQVVLDYAGRIYLTKDARMSERVFKQGYPQWESFCRIRQEYGADRVFNSEQSRRLGI